MGILAQKFRIPTIQPTNHMELEKEDQSIHASILHRTGNKIKQSQEEKRRVCPGRERGRREKGEKDQVLEGTEVQRVRGDWELEVATEKSQMPRKQDAPRTLG